MQPSLLSTVFPQAKSEREALARQSAVALGDALTDERLGAALLQIEALSAQVRTKDDEHKAQLAELQVNR